LPDPETFHKQDILDINSKGLRKQGTGSYDRFCPTITICVTPFFLYIIDGV